MTNLSEVLKPADAPRVEATLGQLINHFEPNEYCVVGGLAIRYFVLDSGQEYPQRSFNDIDVVVKNPITVRASVADSFKIAHYHNDENDFYWALVDPETGIKIDIFKWPAHEPRTTLVPFGNTVVPLQSAEDQLAATIFDTTKVLRGGKVHPKQFQDTELLLSIADVHRADVIFADLYGSSQPHLATVRTAFEATSAKIESHPDLVSTKPHAKPKDDVCRECITIDAYPLTPLPEIEKLLNK